MLRIAQASVPIYIGAYSREDLGKQNPAVDYLIDTVNSNPGEMSLLAIGPLTNVATAMMLDAGFAGNLRELIIMGGTLAFPFFSRVGEFNFHCDGRAAAWVIRCSIPKTVITMDLCSQAVFRREHLQRLEKNDSSVSRYLTSTIPSWLNLNSKVFFRKKGFFPWDPVAAAYLIDQSLFDKNRYAFDVAETGLRAGRLLNLRRLDDSQKRNDAAPINLPLRLDAARFMDLFLERLISL